MERQWVVQTVMEYRTVWRHVTTVGHCEAEETEVATKGTWEHESSFNTVHHFYWLSQLQQ